MDTNKPQTSDEEGSPPPPLVTRSPYRPLSLRRRQALPPEPQPAVARPAASSVFTASPSTIAAALAKSGAGPDGALVWGGDADAAAEAAGDGSPATPGE